MNNSSKEFDFPEDHLNNFNEINTQNRYGLLKLLFSLILILILIISIIKFIVKYCFSHSQSQNKFPIKNFIQGLYPYLKVKSK